MSLQRRLLLYLLVCAPLVWGLAALSSVSRARHQVNELFDTELIRLARQTQATLSATAPGPTALAARPAPAPAAVQDAEGDGSSTWGEADVRDLAIAVWDARGQRLVSDREGAALPYRPQATGFVDEALGGEPWRIYVLQSADGSWLVAAGQKTEEREELVWEIIASQVLPWLLVLPLLLAAMAWAVQRALAPVKALSAELGSRGADDLRPVPAAQAPAELRPLLQAMNGLFGRIEDTLARERRFTADAAHELRTPLAVLRAQFDGLAHAAGAAERHAAAQRLGSGLTRLERLVTQLLMLSRLESGDTLPQTAPVQWPRVVEQAMNDVLPLAERRRIELACDWPADGAAPLPLQGDEHLLTVLLRNLLDNAVRYAPEGSAVGLRFEAAQMLLENTGEPLPAAELARLGERFHRPEGAAESGSGLGVSIVQRIAALHGLALQFGPCADGRGMRVRLARA